MDPHHLRGGKDLRLQDEETSLLLIHVTPHPGSVNTGERLPSPVLYFLEFEMRGLGQEDLQGLNSICL